MMIEYERVQARMDEVKNPNYLASLHEKLEGLKREIKAVEKENRDLTIEQKKREVDMEKLLA
jgi:regulator of replication initiation timing